jgi:hypothetical protein
MILELGHGGMWLGILAVRVLGPCGYANTEDRAVATLSMSEK